LFGFAAHPLKFWDDNLPKTAPLLTLKDIYLDYGECNEYEILKRIDRSFYKQWKKKEEEINSKKQEKLDEENGKISQRNSFIEMSTVSHFPCVQFWTSSSYIDSSIFSAENMMYVASVDSDKNSLNLDLGKISSIGKESYGFACVRYVKDVEKINKKKKK